MAAGAGDRDLSAIYRGLFDKVFQVQKHYLKA